MNKPLYQEDIVLWSADQAQALRAAGIAWINTPDPIDWDIVAQEIEALGRLERNSLRSHVSVIVEHLMRLETSSAMQPRPDWSTTIRRGRKQIEALLDDSPGLRLEVAGMLAWAIPRTQRDVAGTLADYAEQPATDLNRLSYNEQQILGD